MGTVTTMVSEDSVCKLVWEWTEPIPFYLRCAGLSGPLNRWTCIWAIIVWVLYAFAVFIMLEPFSCEMTRFILASSLYREALAHLFLMSLIDVQSPPCAHLWLYICSAASVGDFV